MDDALPYTYDPLLSTSPTIKGGKINILLLGCCTIFLSSLIKYYLQLAKKSIASIHSLPSYWMNEVTNK